MQWILHTAFVLKLIHIPVCIHKGAQHAGQWTSRTTPQWQLHHYFARGRQSIVMSTSVCLSVCLSASVSPKPHARSLPIFLCILPMVMARSSDRVTKSKGKRAVLGFFLPHWQRIVTCSLQKRSAGERVMGVHSAGEVWSTIALFMFATSVLVNAQSYLLSPTATNYVLPCFPCTTHHAIYEIRSYSLDYQHQLLAS